MRKNVKRARKWFFTLKGDETLQERIEWEFRNYTYVCQLEQGDGGFVHWQGFINNEQPISFDTLKRKFRQIHLESVRGSDIQAYRYVTKLETALGFNQAGERVLVADNPQAVKITCSSGDWRGFEALKDTRLDMKPHTHIHVLLKQGMTAEEIIDQYPDYTLRYAAIREAEKGLERKRKAQENKLKKRWETEKRLGIEVFYIYGAAGAGKTRHVVDTEGIGRVYMVTDYRHPFDNYNGEDVLSLEEYYGQIQTDYLLKLLDIYPVQLGARYWNKWAYYQRVYIVSNEGVK